MDDLIFTNENGAQLDFVLTAYPPHALCIETRLGHLALAFIDEGMLYLKLPARRCGYTDFARELRDKTLQLLMRHNDIYEYYNPETG